MADCDICWPDPCTCWLYESKPTEAPVVEKERDFTKDELGLRIRRPRGKVVRCLKCGRNGVYYRMPGYGKARPSVDIWVHRALVSKVGYGIIESCKVIVPKMTRRRTKKAGSSSSEPSSENK